MLKESEENKEPEVVSEPRKKRPYNKTSERWTRGEKPTSASEELPAAFEQGKSARCLGCPVKAELRILQAMHRGYRLAISDLGGHNGTD